MKGVANPLSEHYTWVHTSISRCQCTGEELIMSTVNQGRDMTCGPRCGGRSREEWRVMVWSEVDMSEEQNVVTCLRTASKWYVLNALGQEQNG
jgi:hypothetical protein